MQVQMMQSEAIKAALRAELDTLRLHRSAHTGVQILTYLDSEAPGRGWL